MRVSEALEFFDNVPKIKSKLKVLEDVGLGYIKLGQSAPTLSGGEAERVKLAKELQKKATGKSLFVLDEPTTGLHTDDIKRLLAILQKIVDNNDTVIVIEHNLDVIKVADYIIDLANNYGLGTWDWIALIISVFSLSVALFSFIIAKIISFVNPDLAKFHFLIFRIICIFFLNTIVIFLKIWYCIY